jgi:hypothetical protein
MNIIKKSHTDVIPILLPNIHLSSLASMSVKHLRLHVDNWDMYFSFLMILTCNYNEINQLQDMTKLHISRQALDLLAIFMLTTFFLRWCSNRNSAMNFAVAGLIGICRFSIISVTFSRSILKRWILFSSRIKIVNCSLHSTDVFLRECYSRVFLRLLISNGK